MSDFDHNAKEKISVVVEPSGSFGVENTTYGSYLGVVHERGAASWELQYQLIEGGSTREQLDDMDPALLGPKRCTLAFTVTGHGHGLPLTGNHTTSVPDESRWFLARLLKTIMGGLSIPAGGGTAYDVQAGSTPTSILLDTGQGATLAEGGALAVHTTVSGASRVECVEIEDITGDTITPRWALQGTPSEGPAYGAATFYLTEGPWQSLQFVVEGDGATDTASLRGMLGGFTIEKTQGGKMRLTFSFNGEGWDRKNTTGLISAPLRTYYNELVVKPSSMVFPAVGSTSRVDFCQSQNTWQINLNFEEIPCGKAPEGFDGWWRTKADGGVVTASFTAPRDEDVAEDADGDYFYTQRDGRTEHMLAEQIGDVISTTSSCWLICARQVQITSVKPAEYGTGIRGQEVGVRGRTYQNSGTTDLATAALAFHVFC